VYPLRYTLLPRLGRRLWVGTAKNCEYNLAKDKKSCQYPYDCPNNLLFAHNRLSSTRSIPASQLLNKSNPNSNNKQIIATIIFLALIKNKEFAIHLNLVHIFFNPKVHLTALFANWNTCPPIISIVMPLLFSVSHDISIDCRDSEIWRRSNDGKPGWAAKCNLCATGDRKSDKER